MYKNKWGQEDAIMATWISNVIYYSRTGIQSIACKTIYNIVWLLLPAASSGTNLETTGFTKLHFHSFKGTWVAKLVKELNYKRDRQAAIVEDGEGLQASTRRNQNHTLYCQAPLPLGHSPQWEKNSTNTKTEIPRYNKSGYSSECKKIIRRLIPGMASCMKRASLKIQTH